MEEIFLTRTRSSIVEYDRSDTLVLAHFMLVEHVPEERPVDSRIKGPSIHLR
jgi:hypothetical protein